jgi:uncharacterized phage protein gp47/JayE
MIDFSGQTKEAIQRRQLGRVPESVDKRELSLIQTALGPESWQFEGAYMDLDRMQRDARAQSAMGEALDDKVAERGLSRKAAVAAVRVGRFNIAVPPGARFSAMGGPGAPTFAAAESLGEQADGSWHSLLRCEAAGPGGNECGGRLLPITHMPGLELAELLGVHSAGAGEEEDEPLRRRYFASLTEQAFGGNAAAYRKLLTGMDEVGAAQIYPAYRGGGTVLCSVLDANCGIMAPATLEKIQGIVCPPEDPGGEPSDLGLGFAPIGAKATVATAAALPVSVEMELQLSAGSTPAGVQERVDEAVGAYFLSVRRAWGEPLAGSAAEYPVFVYRVRIISAVLALDGVVNVIGAALNGAERDIECVETGELQQAPFLDGQVTIHAS